MYISLIQFLFNSIHESGKLNGKFLYLNVILRMNVKIYNNYINKNQHSINKLLHCFPNYCQTLLKILNLLKLKFKNYL